MELCMFEDCGEQDCWSVPCLDRLQMITINPCRSPIIMCYFLNSLSQLSLPQLNAIHQVSASLHFNPHKLKSGLLFWLWTGHFSNSEVNKNQFLYLEQMLRTHVLRRKLPKTSFLNDCWKGPVWPVTCLVWTLKYVGIDSELNTMCHNHKILLTSWQV